jgi:uncharacterized damage-inducible protein DinB
MSHRRLFVALAVTVCTLLAVGRASAQMSPAPAAANPLSASLKTMYDGVARNFVEAAEKVSEADYAFQPTPDVRTFGRLVGHLADANYAACARAKGEKNPNDGNSFEMGAERAEAAKVTAKADLVKAVKDSVAYCGTVYGGATDTTLLQSMKVGEPPNQREMLRVTPLVGNISHSNEHYGNIVTYMRLKGLVPPSTERAQQPMRAPSGR